MPRFKTSDVADADTQQCTFADLSLSPPLLRSLQDMGCEHPSPVQMRTIPAALDGSDVIVQAKSGTGKTIAFCSIILEGIDITRHVTQAMVLTPTREISMQVADELQRLSWYMDPPVDVACFIGGVSEEEDQARIKQKGSPHVAACTPGRTVKLLRDRTLQTDMRFLVLDEADKLLKDSFRDVVKEITERIYTDSLQFLTVSATFPPPQVTEAENLFVMVEKKRAKMGAPPMRALAKQVFLCTSAIKKGKDGRALVGATVDEAGDAVESAVLKGVLHFRHIVPGFHVRQKLPALLEILTTAAYQQAFVFCNDSQSAVHIAELLSQSGIPAAASSGRLEQSQRAQAFAGLKRCHYRVLVCTDLFSRGVDSEHVDVVVNLDLPAEKETYLHRSGRTARFGSIGWSVSVVFEGDESAHLNYFQMQLGFQLEEYSNREEVIAAHLAELGADPGSLPHSHHPQVMPAAAPPARPAAASAPPASAAITQTRPSLPHPATHCHAAGLDAPDEASNCDEDEEWQEEYEEEWDHFEEEREEEEEAEAEEEEEVLAAEMPAAAAAAVPQGTWTSERFSQSCAGQQHSTSSLLQLQEQLCEQHLLRQRQQELEQQLLHQRQQELQLQQHLQLQQQLLHGLPSAAACGVPPGLAQQSQALPVQQCSAGNGPVAELLRRYPPPPILFNQSAPTPPEQRALLPEWEAWMLRCASFPEYAGRCPGYAGLDSFQQPTMRSHPFLQHADVPGRLQALWAAHCRIWTAAH